jgi:hypothetical protein
VGQVREAVAAAVRAFGLSGCAGRVAQVFGDHLEAAVIRMRWARRVARGAFAVPGPGQGPGRGRGCRRVAGRRSAAARWARVGLCERGCGVTAMIGDFFPEAGGRMRSRERPAGRDVLYGRAAEQEVIGDLLRRAGRGAGGVLLVDGEPGIGTSLLLRNAADEAAGQGFSWPRAPRTSWAGRSRSSRCARPCAGGSPGRPLAVPVGICRVALRGGSPRCGRTSSSGRRLRSWSAWMTCTGPARPRWPRCGRCRGT